MIRQSLTAYGQPLSQTMTALPTPTGTEVLVKVSRCGVCHSDLHLQDGHFDLGGGKKLDVASGRSLPFTLGHEISGHVEAAGPEAGAIDPRLLYAVYAWIGCGTCGRCLGGSEHLCDRPRQIGINVDGGFASHVMVPHPRYLIDASGIDPVIAGSYMCSGLTAYGAIAKALPYLHGRPLGLVGLGGVGLMGVQIAKALSPVPIIAADIAATRRAAGLSAGATAVVDPAQSDARKQLISDYGACGAVIDFVGSDTSLQFAQGITAKAGAVVVVGLMGGLFSLPVPMFPLRELAILGSYVGSLRQAHELIELARAGQVAAIPVGERPLAEANHALDALRAGHITGRTVLVP